VDYSLELVLIPVSNVDRAKDFYLGKAGFTLEVDNNVGDQIRIVQVTPPGSGCSIGFTEVPVGCRPDALAGGAGHTGTSGSPGAGEISGWSAASTVSA
jgi:hypothetical protein